MAIVRDYALFRPIGDDLAMYPLAVGSNPLFIRIVLAPCCGTGIKRRGERFARMEGSHVFLEEELSDRAITFTNWLHDQYRRLCAI
jgi:hypothetical protein